MSIYVGAGRINYPAMRGPCPYGYHVASHTEWNKLFSAGQTLGAWTSTGGDNVKTYLKMPFAGGRIQSSGGINFQNTSGNYWSSTAEGTYRAYIADIKSTSISTNASDVRSYGRCIRPFKDEPVIPTSSWTVLYQGTGSAGIFHNASSGIISISANGTDWITIADKNLGATTVYNNGDTLSEANYGKFFQRGNNYPFAGTGSVTTSSSQVNASGYGPGNWYYSSTFITRSSSPYDRSSVQNDNLRGGVVGAVKADVKDICVGAGVLDRTINQGPCPDGFHVPLHSEWTAVNNAGKTLGAWTSTGGNELSSYLKLPVMGRRNRSNSNIDNQSLYYRSCHSYNDNQANNLYYFPGSPTIYPGDAMDKSYAFPIRAFKNEPVVPDNTWTTLYAGTGSAGIFWNKGLGLISISSDGTTWYTMADKNLGAKVVRNSGDTVTADNGGGFFQRGNNYMFPFSGTISSTTTTKVEGAGFGAGNYYNSSTFVKVTSSPYSWINQANKDLRGPILNELGGSYRKGNVKQVYVGTTIARPTYNPGIYWNKTKGLISISSDGKNWITMADKNLGAKVVYNDGDTLSQDNCGLYYQWGNNYGFAWTGSLTTTTTKVNTSTYGPTNPYYGSTFVKVSSSPYDWSSNQNDNLWGDTTNTLVARQGPCPTGFHVHSERLDVYKILVNDFGLPANGNTMKTYLKLPFAGYRSGSSTSATSQGTTGRYWTSNAYQATTADYMDITSDHIYPNSGNSRSNSASIRPFKNEPVVPDNSRAVLYQPS